MSLKQLIDKAINLKKYNKEFALFYFPQSKEPWYAMLGNPTNSVSLGEVNGEINSEADTPEKAVEGLIEKIKKWNEENAR